MANLSVEYMGLELPSPFIAGSTGLTMDVNRSIEFEKSGAGAVVLKSLFEEQINNEVSAMLGDATKYPEMEDYLHSYARQNAIGKYLDHIKELKDKLSIPIIASISCYSHGEWTAYAKEIALAGADGLEINIYDLPINPYNNSDEIEEGYSRVIKEVSSKVSIPVSAKIGKNFTNISGFINKLYANGANGVVLFNRFFTPDIDLEKMTLVPANPFSSSSEYVHTLRWIAIVSAAVRNVDISASTGYHTAEDAIKAILVGAKTVQFSSVLYSSGSYIFRELNVGLERFMEKKGFNSVEEMSGVLSYSKIDNPSIFERVQYFK